MTLMFKCLFDLALINAICITGTRGITRDGQWE